MWAIVGLDDVKLIDGVSRVPVVHSPSARRTRRISKGRDAPRDGPAGPDDGAFGARPARQGLAPDTTARLGKPKRECGSSFAPTGGGGDFPGPTGQLRVSSFSFLVPRAGFVGACRRFRDTGERHRETLFEEGPRPSAAGEREVSERKKPAHGARARFLLSTFRIALCWG